MPNFKQHNFGDLYINKLVRCYFMMKQEYFDVDDFHCQFISSHDPRKDGEQVIEFSRNDFIDLDQELKEIDLQLTNDFLLEKFAVLNVFNH